jgi:hypothetical protein
MMTEDKVSRACFLEARGVSLELLLLTCLSFDFEFVVFDILLSPL